jgi:hypothetical protein
MAKGLTDESPVEKCERLMSEIEAKYGPASDASDDPVAKANRLMDEIERGDSDHVAKRTPADDVLLKVSSRHIQELALRLNIDPTSPTALADLRKEANARPNFVRDFLAEPAEALTMGPGAAHVMTKERIEEIAKARGIAQTGDFKRG